MQPGHAQLVGAASRVDHGNDLHIIRNTIQLGVGAVGAHHCSPTTRGNNTYILMVLDKVTAGGGSMWPQPAGTGGTASGDHKS